MSSNRVFYACQSVHMVPSFTEDQLPQDQTNWQMLKGVQSIGISTSMNSEPIFSLGKLKRASMITSKPEVTVNINRIIDSGPSIYTNTMGNTPQNTMEDVLLETTANKRGGIRLNIAPDNRAATIGDSIQTLEIKPIYLSSITYNFPIDGDCTEEATLVGNTKKFDTISINRSDPVYFDFLDIDPPRRNNVYYTTPSVTVGDHKHIQNIRVTLDLGTRKPLYRMGDKVPLTRFIEFPVEVKTEIEVIMPNNDSIGLSDGVGCTYVNSVFDEFISVGLCNGLTINLGNNNRLIDIDVQGGNAGEDNVVTTYTYVNHNFFTFSPPTSPP